MCSAPSGFWYITVRSVQVSGDHDHRFHYRRQTIVKLQFLETIDEFFFFRSEAQIG